MFCCFRILAGMRSLSGMRSENSLGISPPFAKPRTPPPFAKPRTPPPFAKTPNTLPLCQTPNTSPFTKGGRGDFHSRRGLQTMLPYNPGLKPPARVLRRTMTDAERPLWSRVQGKQIGPVQFYRQKREIVIQSSISESSLTWFFSSVIWNRPVCSGPIQLFAAGAETGHFSSHRGRINRLRSGGARYSCSPPSLRNWRR
jgi:hypothetical protein